MATTLQSPQDYINMYAPGASPDFSMATQGGVDISPNSTGMIGPDGRKWEAYEGGKGGSYSTSALDEMAVQGPDGKWYLPPEGVAFQKQLLPAQKEGFLDKWGFPLTAAAFGGLAALGGGAAAAEGMGATGGSIQNVLQGGMSMAPDYAGMSALVPGTTPYALMPTTGTDLLMGAGAGAAAGGALGSGLTGGDMAQYNGGASGMDLTSGTNPWAQLDSWSAPGSAADAARLSAMGVNGLTGAAGNSALSKLLGGGALGSLGNILGTAGATYLGVQQADSLAESMRNIAANQQAQAKQYLDFGQNAGNKYQDQANAAADKYLGLSNAEADKYLQYGKDASQQYLNYGQEQADKYRNYANEAADKYTNYGREQGDIYRGLANQEADKYLGMGQPYRDRLNASYGPGFDIFQADPALQGAVDQSSNALLRQLSTSGNPYDNPGGLMEAQKYVTQNVALPQLNTYRNQLGTFGQMGIPQAGALNQQGLSLGAGLTGQGLGIGGQLTSQGLGLSSDFMKQGLNNSANFLNQGLGLSANFRNTGLNQSANLTGQGLALGSALTGQGLRESAGLMGNVSNLNSQAALSEANKYGVLGQGLGALSTPSDPIAQYKNFLNSGNWF